MLLRSPAPIRWTPLLGLLLAACNPSPSGSGPSLLPSVTNLGLAAESSALAGEGDLWLFAVREFETGGRDLNDDRDAFDRVVFVQDLGSGTTRNLSLALGGPGAASLLEVSGSLAIFAASEQESRRRDLNGDGDLLDAVLHVHDATSGTTRSLGLALSQLPGSEPAVGDGLVAFAVSEAAQGGQDLDGDGGTSGSILFVYDAAAKDLVNTYLDVPDRLFIQGGRVAFLMRETEGDRNGDGDELDLVLQVYDPVTGNLANSGLATDGAEPLFAGGTWLATVPEFAQGASDLNGDGDAGDFVLHVFDPASGARRNLRFDCPDPSCAVALRRAGGTQVFALLALEVDARDTGGAAGPDGSSADLNGDGDLEDGVLALFDPASGELRNTGLAGVFPPVLAGDVVGFLVLEADQGIDLDGDGDLLDGVAFRIDPGSGIATNLGLDAIQLRGSEDLLVLARLEQGEDWNGDGDRDDVVVHLFDPAASTATNTRLASVDVFGVGAREVLLYASEAADARDLNQDGDLGDEVFVLFDRKEETNQSLNLAGGFGEARFGALNRAGRLVLLANEAAQGRDLTGDGDLFDDVLHRAE